jgi:quaternary ammonium compound-resistance protein SugE
MPEFTATPLGAWILVVVSGVFEILFSVMMKQSNGFTQPVASIVAVAAGLVSIWVMTISLRTIPLGASYAVWAGIGALGTALASMVLYSEPFTFAKSAFLLLIVLGIVGLQLQGAE